MSSVTPNDSASNAGKKKARPGKAQRLAAKASLPQGASASTAPSSVSAASSFARAAESAPIPQPGKYPVVFQSGAGEPTRDSEFAYSHDSLGFILKDLAGRYVENAKYAEFASNAGLEDETFRKRIVVAFLLGLAQQTVHAHVNMGLPQGDFSPVFSSDVHHLAAVRSILCQFGEFSSDMSGTRYLLADYQSTVSSLILAADRINRDEVAPRVVERMWLPMYEGDRRTKLIVAIAINAFLGGANVGYDIATLSASVFSGSPPDGWDTMKQFLGDEPAEGERDMRDRFDFLFSSYTSTINFAAAFNAQNLQSLGELGLHWQHPDHSHMDWTFNSKSCFSNLVDAWARWKSSLTKFFSCGSGVSNRAEARGSPSQMIEVSSSNSVTVLRTAVAVSAPEFSLAACFPSSAFFASLGPRNVVLTTSINVSQQATEFTQLDWL